MRRMSQTVDVLHTVPALDLLQRDLHRALGEVLQSRVPDLQVCENKELATN